jgi:hypothetical protein
MMLYQTHVFSWYQTSQLRVCNISVHAFACFWLADRISIPRNDQRWHVDVFEDRSCIVAKHSQHASCHDSWRGLQLKAGYEIQRAGGLSSPERTRRQTPRMGIKQLVGGGL